MPVGQGCFELRFGPRAVPARIGQQRHLALDFLLLLAARQEQVVIGLQAGPHFRAGAEAMRQAQGGVGGDAALFEHDLPFTPYRWTESVT